jgi:hypothetical protein
MRTRTTTIRCAALIVVGCAMTLICGQAQTSGTVASRREVAPQGCVYAKAWKPLVTLTAPKGLDPIPASNDLSEGFLFSGRSGGDYFLKASQSNTAIGVTLLPPPTISSVAAWLYDRTPSLELLCGVHDNL